MAGDLTTLLGSLKTYLDRPLEENLTLEPAHYTSPELYELEIERIWRKEWICVGHVADVRNSGDYVGIELIGEPMLIVRGEDGKIRALSSVCRHRFMPIVKDGERGNLSRLQCPYHRWTYGLDGQLRQALYMEENRRFDMKKVRLPEFRLEIWNDFIFVNLDDDAEPLAPRLVELDPYFSPCATPETRNWVCDSTDYYDKRWHANWKSCNENSCESYHHMGVHVDTIEVYTPTVLVRKCTYGDGWSRYEAPYALDRGLAQDSLKRSGWKRGDLGQTEPRLDIYMIAPCNAFTISPRGPGYFTMWPVSIDETRVFCGTPHPPWSTEIDPRLRTNVLEEVMDEDGVAMSGIARAVHSRKLEAGMTTWLEEPILRWYQWIARKVLDGEA